MSRRRGGGVRLTGIALLVVALAAASCSVASEGDVAVSSVRGDAVEAPSAPAVEAPGAPAADGGGSVAAGSGSAPEALPASDGAGQGFVSVSLGGRVGCALRAGGEVACWGGMERGSS